MNRSPAVVTLAPEVRETLGRSSAKVHAALTSEARFLVALSQKALRTGTPVFAGISPAERDRRRAKGRVARASRKMNRR